MPVEQHTEQPDHAWRARTGRIAPLIDAAAYFGAAREAIMNARRQVLIVGWELHSEVELLRGEQAEHRRDDRPVVLADLLQWAVEERPELRVYLLIWSGASLFALEREHLPRMKRPWEMHERIRLEWDRDTPSLGSQHQKLVVVDDLVAFVGGIDLTKARWDTHEHKREDPRRRTPGMFSSPSHPYHDAMLALDSDAARTLGEHARSRWRRATGESLDPPTLDESPPDPWPASVEPLLRDREVSFALTEPKFNGRVGTRQVERSFLDQFRAARSLIYLETQYLAAERLAEVLADRLREPRGPEVVIVLPYGCPGLVQSIAMDRQRDRLLDRLRDADEHDRLRALWPTLAGGDTTRPFADSVYVHAKVTVIDDRLLRIGSANLNNRSMGLDSELDAFIEVGDDAEARGRVASFRRRSMSYLLGCDAEEIARAEADAGSVVAAIDRLRGGERTLWPFEHRAAKLARAVPLDIRLADPDEPPDELDTQRVLEALAESTGIPERARLARSRLIGLARRHKPAAALLAVACLAFGATLGLASGNAGWWVGPIATLALLAVAIALAAAFAAGPRLTSDSARGDA